MERKSDGFDNQKVIVIPNDILKILASDKLTRLLYITDIGFYPHAAGHYRSRKDGSNQNILIYCKDGEGWYMVNGKRCTVGRNQFFVISAGTPHIYAASDTNPWSIFWMHFTGEMADLSTICIIRHIPFLKLLIQDLMQETRCLKRYSSTFGEIITSKTFGILPWCYGISSVRWRISHSSG